MADGLHLAIGGAARTSPLTAGAPVDADVSDPGAMAAVNHSVALMTVPA